MNVVITGLLVCLARILDVTLNTLKLKSMMRGKKLIASSLAFVEVLVYMLAASKAFKYIDNPIILLFYCVGYALGNYIGITLDEKISNGIYFVLLIGDKDEDIIELADLLRDKGYGVTTDKGYGLNGSPKIQIKTIVEKKKLGELQEIVSNFKSKNIFMTLFEVKDAKSLSCASLDTRS